MSSQRSESSSNKICLCSSSPTRALLLEQFGIDFIQNTPSYDEEQIVAANAKDFVYTASKGKMEAAIKEFGLEIPLLCADTVITASDGTVLRKPRNIEDARRILEIQSGSVIFIISSLHFQSKKLLFSDTSATQYHFASFDSIDMEAYLQSGLWQGKAGGCMVEGFCKKYIKSVEGLESTAMGLQVEKLLPWIGRHHV
ncbi:MAG TPA: septum formation inhibitor Maf [Sulfurovum sp. UBA12169]|jgi:MAF protein|nr:MAG TPA: septum formation inhibitor Maf [Sulfurovum sp. UBA12169]